MHKDYKSYQILHSLSEDILDNLEVDKSLGVLELPFSFTEDSSGVELVEFQDIVFYNTKLFSPAGEYYKKHGAYTKLHPIYDNREYTKFWDEEERRRKEGYVAPCAVVKRDDGSYCLRELHITGENYGYLNYAPIKRVPDGPLWEATRMLMNGAEPEDVKHLVDKKEVDLPLFLDSDFYYFKSLELARLKSKHMVVAKARRKGYSYKNGWCSADKADLYRNSVTILAAYHADSLYPEGTMAMADSFLQHIAKTTDWRKRRLKDSEDFIKFGYTLNDNTGIEHGYLSRIMAVSTAPNNPGAPRGKDGTFIMMEESGKNPLLRATLDSTLPTLKAGIFVTGLMVVFGTGGGEDKQWEDFEDLFYFPSVDDFLSFNNIWDDDGRGTECGLFVPSFMGKEGFFDEHGNSNVVAAINFENRQREKRKKSNKPDALANYVMEEPFSPKEAFSRAKVNIFPSIELEEQLRRVKKDPSIKALTRTGLLAYDGNGKVKFKDKIFMTDEELKHYHPPITRYPIKKEDDPTGCIVIWEHPYRDRETGLIPGNLYRGEHDPFALPKATGSITVRDSLGVTYIYKRTNNVSGDIGDKLVASYIGRPPSTKDYNIEMFKLLEYYNAQLQFESNRGDVLSHAQQMGKLHLLADEPEIFTQKNLGTPSRFKKKGITMNTDRKENGVVYLRDWLIEPRGTDEFGNKILNLHCIYDEGLLMELLKFNFKNNFDRVSARIIGMFDKREVFKKEIQKPQVITPNSVFNRDWY